MTSPRSIATLGAAFAAATAALVFTATAAAAAAPPLSVAIVVGSNHSPSAALENLRYGDDDAVQNARTLTLLGAETTLLVAPDAETRELFPMTHPDGPATRAALRAAFAHAATTLAAARAAGRHTELYFLFAGHGDMADGRPFLQLDDGRLWREDVGEMMRTAAADENHVIVDACYASSFVSSRGPGGERERLPAGFSHSERAVWPAHTGFLTARSSGGQTHEWAEYQSGVFSHELRSGLVGAADVNLDGRVTYREIAAFVRRANEAIPNRRYRPELSTVPPEGNLDASLATLPSGPIVLEMDLLPAGRSFVETENGIRLVDLHTAPGLPVRLRLPTDLGNLFVEQVAATGGSATREFRVQPRAGHVSMSALAEETSRVRTRGAGHEAFMHLFARPFDTAAVMAFRLDEGDAADIELAKQAEDADRKQTLRHKIGRDALGLAVVTGAVGAGFALNWARIHYYGSDGTSVQNEAANARAKPSWITAEVLGGVAAASAITGAVLLLWPQAPNVSVATTPGCEACFAYQRSF
jgi:hypothetical protein